MPLSILPRTAQVEVRLLLRQSRMGWLFVVLIATWLGLPIIAEQAGVSVVSVPPQTVIFLLSAYSIHFFANPFYGGISERRFHATHPTPLLQIVRTKSATSLFVTSAFLVATFLLVVWRADTATIAACAMLAMTTTSVHALFGTLMIVRQTETASEGNLIRDQLFYGMIMACGGLLFAALQAGPAPLITTGFATSVCLAVWWFAVVPFVTRRMETRSALRTR